MLAIVLPLVFAVEYIVSYCLAISEYRRVLCCNYIAVVNAGEYFFCYCPVISGSWRIFCWLLFCHM